MWTLSLKCFLGLLAVTQRSGLAGIRRQSKTDGRSGASC